MTTDSMLSGAVLVFVFGVLAWAVVRLAQLVVRITVGTCPKCGRHM